MTTNAVTPRTTVRAPRRSSRLVDLSQPIGNGMFHSRRYPPPALKQLSSVEVDGVSVTHAYFAVHSGTHVDAPTHFLPDAESITDIPVDRFVGEGLVVEVHRSAREEITVDDVATTVEAFGPDAMLCLRTGWDTRYADAEDYRQYPHLSLELAHALVDLQVRMLAVDTPSPDLAEGPRPDGFNWPVHRILMGGGSSSPSRSSDWTSCRGSGSGCTPANRAHRQRRGARPCRRGDTRVTTRTALPRVVDLTRGLRHMGPSTLSQPVPMMMWPTLTHERSSVSFEGALSIASMGVLVSDHAGTHVDAWKRLTNDPEAAAIDEMPLTDFMGRGIVLDASVTPVDGVVDVEVLQHSEVPEGTDAVLVRTAAVADPPPDRQTYLERFPGLGAGLVHALAARGVRILGTDARSVDRSEHESGPHGLPVHTACLQHGMVVVENLLLPTDLVGEHFLFLALPLRLVGCTCSPVRAVALL